MRWQEKLETNVIKESLLCLRYAEVKSMIELICEDLRKRITIVKSISDLINTLRQKLSN